MELISYNPYMKIEKLNIKLHRFAEYPHLASKFCELTRVGGGVPRTAA